MSELNEAIANGDTGLAIKLIENGADVNARHEGQTPLYVALAYGRIRLFKYLKKTNAKIDSPLGLQSPLAVAIHHNQTKMIEYLVNKCGKNVNATFYRKKIPLNIAIDDDNFEMVKFLIKIGANVDNQDLHWYGDPTPLMHAMSKGNIEIIKYIIDNGADVNDGTVHEPALIVAIRQNMFEVVKYLIEKGANWKVISDYKKQLQEELIDREIWDYIDSKTAS